MARGGRRGPAIQLYRALADALKSELDAQPDAETAPLYSAEVTRGSEELTQAPAASAAVDRPGRSGHQATGPLHSYGAPSDVLREPLRLATHAPFRLRAPLAILAGVLIVADAFISYRQFAIPGTSQAVVAERATSALRPARSPSRCFPS